MEMINKKVACVALLCMVAIAVAPGAESLTCPQVTSALLPCLSYLKNTGPLQNKCCTGVQSVVSLAKTTADRRTACSCLKTASKGLSPIGLGKAAGLPGKCGVSIPYKISPSTNCNKVN